MFNIYIKPYIRYIINLLLVSAILLSGCAESNLANFDILEEAKTFFYKEIKVSRKKEKNKNTIDLPVKKINKNANINEDKKLKSDNKIAIKTGEKDTPISKLIIDINKDIDSELGQYDDLKEEEEKKIKFGILLPLTGEHKNYGSAFLNALELSLFQRNNPLIELVIKDTVANPEIASVEFGNLLKENISLLIGPLFSDCVKAIDVLAKEKNIPILAFTNNIDLARPGLWVLGINPGQQVKRLLNYSIDKGKKDFALLLPNNRYGKIVDRELDAALRKKNLFLERKVFYNPDSINSKEPIKLITEGFEELESKEKKVDELELKINVIKEVKIPYDSIFIVASGQNLRILSSQLQYNNVDPKLVQFIGTSEWEPNNVIGEPSLVGGIFAATTKSKSDFFIKRYKKYYNNKVPAIAMLGYDAIALAEESIVNNKIDTSLFSKKEGFIGLRGLFRLHPNGIVERGFSIFKVERNKLKVIDKSSLVFSDF